jgi:hypothetical protein
MVNGVYPLERVEPIKQLNREGGLGGPFERNAGVAAFVLLARF